MWHDTESELCQKLLIIDAFPGKHSISNISGIRNAARQIKFFFEPIFHEELYGICH